VARKHGGSLPSHGTTWGISAIILELAKRRPRVGLASPNLLSMTRWSNGFHAASAGGSLPQPRHEAEALHAVFRHKVGRAWLMETVAYWVADEQGQNVISIDLPR
jgi:hypothetical protein